MERRRSEQRGGDGDGAKGTTEEQLGDGTREWPSVENHDPRSSPPRSSAAMSARQGVANPSRL